MIAYMRRVRRVCHHARDEGSSVLEYSLLVAAIAAVLVVVVFALSNMIKSKNSTTCPTGTHNGLASPRPSSSCAR